MTQISDPKKFPCGCVIADVNSTFTIQPCSPTCEIYAYTIEVARKEGTPIGIVFDNNQEIKEMRNAATLIEP